MKKIKIYNALFFAALSFLYSCSMNPDTEKEKQNILETDKAFSDYSKNNGQIKSFLFYADENATLLRPNSMPVCGKTAIEKLYSAKSDTSYVLTWTPLFAEVGASADIGYSYGTWLLKTTDAEGQEQNAEGTYATIWKKQADGSWKWVLDTGNDGLKKAETTVTEEN